MLAGKVEDCQERLDAQNVGNALYGLQNKSSEHIEVRTLLGVLAGKVADCRERLKAQEVGNALYGLQGMCSEHIEVRTLLGVLASKVEDCQERLNPQEVGNALYGLQGMSSEHIEVWTLLGAMKNHLEHCFNEGTSEHSSFDVLDLLRAFILFRHHLVTILDSDALCTEYHRKLFAELSVRRQRDDPFFATTQFQSTFEKAVYNRVVILAAELQITDLRHNVFLLDCFESDITFTVRDNNGAAVIVNVEVDGIHHEKKRKQTFCQLRDKELTSRGIHVARITATTKSLEIDKLIRKIVDYVRTNTRNCIQYE